MKTTAKLIACGTSALFAAVLSLQAQSTTTPSQPSTSSSQSSQSTSRDQSSSTMERDNSTPRYDINQQSTTDTRRRDQNATDRNTTPRFQIGSDTNTTNSSSTGSTSVYGSSSVTASTEVDTQVSTVVQQIDSQGPVVVERITTQFSGLACNEENARKLVEALHGGTSVTLTGDDGKSVTFAPTARLGYGDTFIAMSLAAEALRSAGVTECATPAQWQAVLLGGDIAGSGTASVTTTTTTKTFPGILTLHSQGQGWGRVAQTTNVQLGQVVSSARTSLNIDTQAGNNSSSSRSVASPSGESKQESALGSQNQDDESSRKDGEKGNSEAAKDNYGQNTARDNDWNKGKQKGHDKDAWKSNNQQQPKSETEEEDEKKNDPERR